MNRQIPTRDEPPPGFVRGTEIDLANWNDHSLALDLNGRAYCYVGYRPEERGRDDPPVDLPFFSPSVGARYPKGREGWRFIRLVGGALRYDRFFGDEGYYRILTDRLVRFPAGADTYFGVLIRESGEEDADLTRQLFGATGEELSGLLMAFSGALGIGHLPRVTFSKTRANTCELSQAVIPREFPYIAFGGSQYQWGHVSMSAFYRTLAFLAVTREQSEIRKRLLERGVPPGLLERVAHCGSEQRLLLTETDER